MFLFYVMHILTLLCALLELGISTKESMNDEMDAHFVVYT